MTATWNRVTTHTTPPARLSAPWRAALPVLTAAGLLLTASLARADEAAPQKVTVRAVAHFDFDKAAIHDEDRARLLAEVATMKDVSWQTVTAIGHTDSVGSPGYNQNLARRRATAVQGYLAAQGLPPVLLRTEARGESAPVAGNDTEAGRAQNRRTEVVFEGVRTAAR